MSHDLLAIYLSDHLAGATAASRRVRRLADAERSAPDGPALSRIADEIAEDRETLLTVMHSANVSPRWYKSLLAAAGERVGLLKVNGSLFHRSPLTSVLELEGLRMGVTGKLALWTSLRDTDLSTQFDFDELIRRAERHLHGLEVAHGRRAAVVAARDQRSPSAIAT